MLETYQGSTIPIMWIKSLLFRGVHFGTGFNSQSTTMS